MTPFRRAPARYGDTPPAQSPYARASAVWDERIGSARAQAFHWRLAALGGLVIIAGQAAGLVWLGTRGGVEPWVVEVDRLGRSQASGPAIRGYQPTDPQIAWRLGEWIRQVRGLPSDPVVLRQNWLGAYELVSDRGGRALGEHARVNDPFAQVGRVQVAVHVDSVVRASPQSFRVAWTERRYADGVETAAQGWVAVLTLVERPPTTAEELTRNPLGVYVDAFDWSPEARS